MLGRFLRVTSLPRAQRFCRLLRHTLREAPHQPPSRLLWRRGWRALMARMAAPLSGMATSDHSCSGDAPLGFGSTVTIFHPVVMHLRLTSSLVSAHPTTSTRRPNQFTATSLPGRVPRDHRESALLTRSALIRPPLRRPRWLWLAGIQAAAQVCGGGTKHASRYGRSVPTG